ncbi:hypothetical protein Poly51_18930 [Rubripirellula tenax]|uniref:FG-GAP repeat protein n=1 Tax=Rubripirellula tenax TaxID=2528015 RepID=A0A5C6FEG5_9BACT|nr:FG-GAP-like repeat-containing protein [Rubripirellula tenax]TWU59107.1 hypothetical protein Poly51_18930 [Rubripirellula tenax]
MNSKTTTIAVLLVGVLIAVAWIVASSKDQPGDLLGNKGAVDSDANAEIEISKQSELTRTALAATENLETEAAEKDWDTLFSQSPDDPSMLKNRALNRILKVDALAGQVANASLEAAVKQQARSQLPDAIAGARAAIDQFAEFSADPVIPVWMRTRIDMQEAALLPASMTKSLRRDIFTQLSEAVGGPIGKQPSSRMLGGSLIEVLGQMEDPIDGLPAETLAAAAETMRLLSDSHPENLFFALRAARLNIDTKSETAAPLVERTGSLARAISPMIARETKAIGMTPEELVADITAKIKSGDWSTAETRMLQWFNVLNGTEIVKTDRRLASPHPLDELSFDSLRRLSSVIAGGAPVPRGDQPIKFEMVPVQTPVPPWIATVVDMDLDLDSDIVTIDMESRIRAMRNDGDGVFVDAGSAKVKFVPAVIVVADLFVVDSSSPDRIRSGGTSVAGRHDTLPCLVLCGDDGVQLVCVDGRTETDDTKRFVFVDGDTGLGDVTGVVAAVAGDLEADGDLDLIFATKNDGVRMFVNRGNRTFFELPRSDEDFGRSDPVTALAIADLDRDLDLDLVTTHASGKVGMLENLLHLQFRGRTLDTISPVAGASQIAVEDVDGNVSWDLVVAGSDSSAIVFSQTAAAGAWTVDHIETADAIAAPFLIADVDNDSWLDLIADSGTASIGPWGFSDISDGSFGTERSEAADFNSDGAIDFAAVGDGSLGVAMNRTASPGHFLDVRFKGIDDNATGRVNHYAIGSVLELRFGPHYRARIVKSPSTHFGIDGYDNARFNAAGNVRAILPNGLTQTTRDIQADTLVEEEQTLKGSCPYLYAWDGEQFEFVTDCLWAAPLGLQVADGVVAKDRPWEYLKIDGRQIRPRSTDEGDRYEFRLTEELWEVAYFDEVAITAVDHPPDVDIWTNEKVGPGQIATPTIFAFGKSDRHTPAVAIDPLGQEVTDQVRRVDGNFMKGFDQRLRQGLCPPHWIDMTFDELSAEGSVYLVMTGWIMPADTSLNIQIDQNDELDPIEFPSVWVPDSESPSGWRNAIPFAGFPGGKTKTIVIDVTDVVDRDDVRMRVRTSAQIYWDAAELVVQSSPATFTTEPMELLSAEVAYHGYSARTKADAKSPELYDYNDASTTPRWPPLAGKLTAAGECTDLLRGWDDRMVVIGAGDEVRLTFAMPEKELPTGWVRDFVMHNVGWDKDADLNTLAGQTIGPLPYRSMTSYPPPVSESEEAEKRNELNEIHRQREQSFRDFWFRPTESL